MPKRNSKLFKKLFTLKLVNFDLYLMNDSLNKSSLNFENLNVLQSKIGKGKKGKKHKKGIMKMFFLAAIVKSKIELLLKVLSFHLQLKFFAIALVGLVINLARFWIDIKKTPQKVSRTVRSTYYLPECFLLD